MSKLIDDTAIRRLRDARPVEPLDLATRMRVKRRLTKSRRRSVFPFVLVTVFGSMALAAVVPSIVDGDDEVRDVGTKHEVSPPKLPDTAQLREAIERLRAGDAAAALELSRSAPERTELSIEFSMVELNALLALNRTDEASTVIDRMLSTNTLTDERRAALSTLLEELKSRSEPP